jgi:CheY-like chemotaxis protein
VEPGSAATWLQHLGLHVLLADDERVNRMIFGRFLQRLGCTFVAVGEGDDAVAELERTGQLPQQQPQPHAVGARGVPTEGTARPFDCVFLDIVMCRTDGAQTCREMRRRGLRLPIIAATGNRACIEYTEAGFDAVLEKPFGQGAVEAFLRQHVLARRSAPAADAVSAT